MQRSGIDEARGCSSISKVERGSNKLWLWCVISRMTRRENAHDESKKNGVEEHPRDWGAHRAVVQKTLGFYTTATVTWKLCSDMVAYCSKLLLGKMAPRLKDPTYCFSRLGVLGPTHDKAKVGWLVEIWLRSMVSTCGPLRLPVSRLALEVCLPLGIVHWPG